MSVPRFRQDGMPICHTLRRFRPHRRCWRCAIIRGTVPVRGVRRAPLLRWCRAHSSRALRVLRARAGEAVFLPTCWRSLPAAGSPGSPVRGSVKARQRLCASDRLPGQPPLPSVAPAPWSLADSQPPPHNPSPTRPAAVRLPATKAYLITHARRVVRMRAEYHARGAVKGVLYIQLWQRRTAPLSSFMEVRKRPSIIL